MEVMKDKDMLIHVQNKNLQDLLSELGNLVVRICDFRNVRTVNSAKSVYA